MKVLLVSPGYPPMTGGVQQHVAAVARALVRRGHQVTVLTLDPPGEHPAKDGGFDGVELVRVPARELGPFMVPLGLRRRLVELARRHDVVHVHNYHSPLPLLTLLLVRGTPVVLTPHFHGGGHSVLAAIAHPLYRWAVRAALPRAAALVFVSAAERARFRAAFAVGDRPDPVIHNGARHPRTGQIGQTGQSRDLVVTIGRLEPYKRVDTIIAALRRLPDPPAFVVVGDGPERARLERLAGTGPVRFAGRVEDDELDDLLARARVAVSASAHEAFGMATLDALAAGATVIASDIPAHRELGELAGPGLTLWDPASGPAGLSELIAAAVGGERAPAGRVEPPILPSWAGAAAALEQLYRQVAPSAAAEDNTSLTISSTTSSSTGSADGWDR